MVLCRALVDEGLHGCVHVGVVGEDRLLPYLLQHLGRADLRDGLGRQVLVEHAGAVCAIAGAPDASPCSDGSQVAVGHVPGLHAQRLSLHRKRGGFD